jgi:hypothetical protein
MGRKQRILPAGLVLIAGIVVGFVWLLQRPHGPESVCQGKPLSYWLPTIERGENPWVTFETNGADAIPMLLQAAEMRGDALKSAYRTVWPKMPGWVKTRWPRPVDAVKVREHAAFLLGTVGDSEFQMRMLKTHHDPRVRAGAAGRLGLDYHNDKATRALAEALPQENDPQAQATIAEQLCYTDENFLIAVPALIEGLLNKNPEVRRIVASMLTGTAFDPSSLDKLRSAYNDSPEEKKKALKELSEALKDKDPAVKDAAAAWLWIIDRQATAKTGVK